MAATIRNMQMLRSVVMGLITRKVVHLRPDYDDDDGGSGGWVAECQAVNLAMATYTN